jgi:signal transduction histidine kinase
LEKAVEWLAEQFQCQYGITIVVSHDALPKPLSEGARVLLFRLVRELLTNVVKHSQASRAEISFQRQGDYLNIRLQDNGIGFDAAQKTPFAADTGGFGLFSVRERLRHLGGFLEVHSIPGEGTKISIVVPLHQPQEFAPVW